MEIQYRNALCVISWFSRYCAPAYLANRIFTDVQIYVFLQRGGVLIIVKKQCVSLRPGRHLFFFMVTRHVSAPYNRACRCTAFARIHDGTGSSVSNCKSRKNKVRTLEKRKQTLFKRKGLLFKRKGILFSRHATFRKPAAVRKRENRPSVTCIWSSGGRFP